MEEREDTMELPCTPRAQDRETQQDGDDGESRQSLGDSDGAQEGEDQKEEGGGEEEEVEEGEEERVKEAKAGGGGQRRTTRLHRSILISFDEQGEKSDLQFYKRLADMRAKYPQWKIRGITHEKELTFIPSKPKTENHHPTQKGADNNTAFSAAGTSQLLTRSAGAGGGLHADPVQLYVEEQHQELKRLRDSSPDLPTTTKDETILLLRRPPTTPCEVRGTGFAPSEQKAIGLVVANTSPRRISGSSPPLLEKNQVEGQNPDFLVAPATTGRNGQEEEDLVSSLHSDDSLGNIIGEPPRRIFKGLTVKLIDGPLLPPPPAKKTTTGEEITVVEEGENVGIVTSIKNEFSFEIRFPDGSTWWCGVDDVVVVPSGGHIRRNGRTEPVNVKAFAAAQGEHHPPHGVTDCGDPIEGKIKQPRQRAAWGETSVKAPSSPRDTPPTAVEDDVGDDDNLGSLLNLEERQVLKALSMKLVAQGGGPTGQKKKESRAAELLNPEEQSALLSYLQGD